MLGKDYMLAIILVNYEDSPWSEGGVDQDGELPLGWRLIRDGAGSYYWHVPTGTTQWQHPSYSGAPGDAQADAMATLTPSHSRTQNLDTEGRRGSRPRLIESPVSSINDRLSWQDDYFCSSLDPNAKCFAVRSLGWVEIPEEELTPGKSSLAVNNCIQQLSHSKTEGRDALGAWGEGQDMMMVLKKDTLSLMDPVDHTLIHSQPILNIRVWGVGCNGGRDFAFVASDKDTCMLKCHVFRCDAPAKAIATALHQMCSKMISEKVSQHASMGRSLTMESISPEDLPHQEGFLDAVRQKVQKFEVQYIGNLPVSRAMGMEVLNRAIESIMNTTDSAEWEPIVVHVSDKVMSLRRGQGDGADPFWECQVRYLTFLGVGHDTHTFAVIVEAGSLRFECHVFWCEPDAGVISEAVQAACMVQYQRCLVAQTPPPRSKMWRAGSKVKRANSMDGFTFPPPALGHSPSKVGSAPSVKKGMLAFFETFRNKQSAIPGP